jgi:hypothetical protein
VLLQGGAMPHDALESCTQRPRSIHLRKAAADERLANLRKFLGHLLQPAARCACAWAQVSAQVCCTASQVPGEPAFCVLILHNLLQPAERLIRTWKRGGEAEAMSAGAGGAGSYELTI